MMLSDHPHIRAIRTAMRSYAKEEDIEVLRATLSGIASAMEADLPAKVREAAFWAEAEIDSVFQRYEASAAHVAISAVVADLERKMADHESSTLTRTT